MKKIAMFLATAATLLSATAFAADSTDRTSMPTNCSDRNANCVIQDGPPRGRRGFEPSTTSQPSGSSSTSGSASTKSGESKSGSNPSPSR